MYPNDNDEATERDYTYEISHRCHSNLLLCLFNLYTIEYKMYIGSARNQNHVIFETTYQYFLIRDNFLKGKAPPTWQFLLQSIQLFQPYHLHSMTKESFIKDPETSHGNPLPNLYLESTRSGDPFEAEIVLRTD